MEPMEPVEIRGRTLEPGTMICALTTTMGDKAASEIPLSSNREAKNYFVPGNIN